MSNQKEKKTTKLEKFFKLIRFVEKYLFRLFFPYDRHGNLTEYNDGALIAVGNHYGYLDVAYPCRLTDKPIRFIAKSELWEKKGFLNWFVKKCECIPVKRDGSDVQAVKDCIRILRNGGIINIFPEGTRNPSYKEFLPFHGGAAALSIKTQTPIVPIVKVTKTKLFKKTHVIYGDPIEFRQYYGKKVTKEQLEECDEILRKAMWNMRLAFLDTHKIKIKGDKV